MGAGEITRQLIAVRSGTAEAMDRLFLLVYEPLKAIARGKVWSGGRTPTLGATALVHEAFLRLVDQTQVDWQDRGHFFAVAARAMRQIAVDHERRRRATKRGGGQVPEPLGEEPAAGGFPPKTCWPSMPRWSGWARRARGSSRSSRCASSPA